MPVVSKINRDLQEERNKVQFNIEEFTNWYYDGANNVAQKRELGKVLKSKVTKFKALNFFVYRKVLLIGPRIKSRS